jgi:hypothetical protein
MTETKTRDHFHVPVTRTLSSVLTLVVAGAALVAADPAGAAQRAESGSVTTTKIAADSSDFGAFGIAVDLNADGTTAIVGAQQHNGNRGGAYIFSLVDGTWMKTADLTRSALQYGDSYGNAVAINGDGTWAAVAEVGWQQLSGRVFVFHRVAGAWHLVSRLHARTPTPYTHFGDSISMDAAGDTIAVGILGAHGFIGRVQLFQRNDSRWQRVDLRPAGTDQQDFGQAVALSTDGSTVVVGANTFKSGVGAAYVFQNDGAGWQRVARLKAKPQVAGANFGNAVAVNTDGSTVAVGAVYEGSGAAYVFTEDAGAWQQTSRLAETGSQQYGSAVSLDGRGTTVIVGAEASQVTGTAYLYSFDGSAWTLQATLTPDGQDQAFFGVSAGLDANGDTGLVGASSDDDGVEGQSGYGAVYVESIS